MLDLCLQNIQWSGFVVTNPDPQAWDSFSRSARFSDAWALQTEKDVLLTIPTLPDLVFSFLGKERL